MGVPSVSRIKGLGSVVGSPGLVVGGTVSAFAFCALLQEKYDSLAQG